MSTTLMTMMAKLGIDSGGFVSGLDKASGAAEKGTGNIVKTLGKIAGVVASAFVVKKIVDFGEAIVNEAMDAENKLAELNAVIASTKGVSGMTSDAVIGIADSLSKLTPFEDDAIVAGESMLLTFTNIGKDVFPQATEAMLNMAQKFGGIEGASIQLGKALNDPIAGVTALRRVGVQLTDQQEASIKQFMAVGDIASAQAVILGELETEFGGLAKAMGNTTLGKITRFKNAWKNVKETLGTALLPVIGKIAGAFGDFLNDNMPKIAAFAEKVGTWIGGAFEKVWDWAGKAWKQVQNFVGVFQAIFGDLASGDVGLAIDDFFEGFYDQLAAVGINVPAAKQLVQDLVAEFAWIPEGISKIFSGSKNIISLAFQGLMGEDVWNDIPSVMDGVTGKLSEGKPGLKTSLMQLGADMQDYIIQGLTTWSTIALNISEKILAWANSPDVLASVGKFGEDMGSGLANAIKLALTGEANTATVSEGIVTMALTAVANIGDALLTIGGKIAGSLVTGAINNLTSSDRGAELGNAIAVFFQNAINAFLGNYPGGFFGLLSDTMNNLTRGLDVGSGKIPAYGGPQANGFNGMVTEPTYFLAGEAGPERVTVTPQGKGGQGDVTVIVNVNAGGQRIIGPVTKALRSKGYA